MRDIRRDLEERLKHLASEKRVFQRRIDLIEEKMAKLTDLLKQEEALWKTIQADLFPSGASPSPSNHSPLGMVLLSLLNDNNPHTTTELVDLAKSQAIIDSNKSPRRAVHFALVGMKQHGLVDMVSSGMWKISDKGKGGEMVRTK